MKSWLIWIIVWEFTSAERLNDGQKCPQKFILKEVILLVSLLIYYNTNINGILI